MTHNYWSFKFDFKNDMRCHFMSAVYFVVATVAILGAVHLIRTNDEIELSKRSASSAYQDTLVRLGHRNDEHSDFDDRIENENDLSFKINDMLDKVIELGKIEIVFMSTKHELKFQISINLSFQRHLKRTTLTKY